MAAGQKVLNVGAAGNVRSYREQGLDGWIHKRLTETAAKVVGLDINLEEIEAARELGYDIASGNCETFASEQRFNLIVLSDVIEHLDNPALALENLASLLTPGGQLVISTPNATAAGNFLRVLLHRPPSVYWDHVALYAPEHIQALCDRHGLRLDSVTFYTLADHSAGTSLAKRLAIAFLGRVFPRLHGAFLCVIAPS